MNGVNSAQEESAVTEGMERVRGNGENEGESDEQPMTLRRAKPNRERTAKTPAAEVSTYRVGATEAARA
ncbi:hypothetical protein ACIRPT_20645 [Streptomyces sp. NPDC101227]|uniref:hypothetical protein n=1 Tax=Streptomyces sp. NPDC101227 TaxID=3366136 RepID=UPI0038009981